MEVIKKIIKRSLFFKYIYSPWAEARSERLYEARRSIFKKKAPHLLRKFVECMDSEHIVYWLEFGTLLGAYRDGGFIPNDFDIDVGVWLRDAKKVNTVLKRNGFKLVREFHVVGENGLEQTYEYHGTTIDVMYFYEEENQYWCNGAVFPSKWHKVIKTQVTAHWFKPFATTRMDFLGMQVSIPGNVEEHLMEIFGAGYKVYDPNFPGDLNKKRYSLEEKWGMGFVEY